MTSAGDRQRCCSAARFARHFAATGEVVMALDGVSLGSRQGTLTALVGPDGAGKTTLIRLVTGLLTADAGELRVLGIDVAARSADRSRNRIGYMPQRFGLYEDLTVQENLDLYADMHGVIARSERRQRYPRAHGDDGAWALHEPAGGPALGRHEAEAGAGLHAGAYRRSCCCWMSRRSASIRFRGGSCGRSSCNWCTTRA